jgi:gas vesicle protein
MNANTQERCDHRFAIGLVTGAFVGVGLAMWFSPRLTAELRKLASEQYQKASAHVGEAVDEITRKGQGVRNDTAETVARGARQVERFAMANSGADPS